MAVVASLVLSQRNSDILTCFCTVRILGEKLRNCVAKIPLLLLRNMIKNRSIAELCTHQNCITVNI
jgi:hypothetical protein